MQLENNSGLDDKLDIKTIVYAVLGVLFVVAVALVSLKFEDTKAYLSLNWKEIVKGIVIGLSSLPLMLLVAFKLQKKPTRARSEEGVSKVLPKDKTAKNCLLWGSVVSVVYTLSMLIYFSDKMDNPVTAFLVGGHLIMCLASTIIMCIAYFKLSRTLSLVAAILFIIAGFMQPLYIIFVIPSIVLGFVAHNKLKKE